MLMARTLALRLPVIMALSMIGALSGTRSFAQNPVSPPKVETQPTAEPSELYLQRSLEIYEYKKAAQSGPERGREIFYYKCWMCHNEFSNTAPRLEGLFSRSTLVTGQPVSETSVKDQIRNGSADMEAFKYTLSDADLNDLVRFIREECCWNSDAPPRNPRYIAH